MDDATIRSYLRQPYHRVLAPEDAGGYTARILEFPGCIAEGDTADEALQALERAAASWLQAALEHGHSIPGVMDDAVIRHLDGPALCRLAWKLGLAPDWAQWKDEWLTAGGILRPANVRHGVIEASSHPWRPDEDTHQAREAFDRLPALGWEITSCTRPDDEPGSSLVFGSCQACHVASFVKVIGWWSTASVRDTEIDTEPLALLRVSVLAVAWMRKEAQALRAPGPGEEA